MTISAYFSGLALSAGLLLAIGAQNAFVLRHGLARQHVFAIALFCSIADGLLIIAGISGVSLLIAGFVAQYESYLFLGAALWLAGYGAIRLYAAIYQAQGSVIVNDDDMPEGNNAPGLAVTLSTLAVLTFGNPHVYLDTVVLLGATSLKFEAASRVAYGAGAVTASFIFFFGLAYGAKALAPQMQRPGAWRVLDLMIAIVMFLLAIGMAHSGGWF